MKLITVLFSLLFGFQLFVFSDKNKSIAYPDQFPSLKHAKFMGGEITMIDHVNRMGILRPDRSDEHNKYHWDLPHHFEMLPYGLIYRHGAPATIRDIDLGTHMHGIFFLGKQGMYKVPLLETQYFQQVRNQPNQYSPDSPYNQALLLEDDFSFYLRQKATWQITHIDHEKGKLTCKRKDYGKVKLEGLTGTQVFDFDSSLKVWQGTNLLEKDALKVNQEVLFNLTWCTLFGPGRITGIWTDEESRKRATKRQRHKYLEYLKKRGFPAQVIEVNHLEEGSGQITLVPYQGYEKLDQETFSENTTGLLAVSESNLRTWDQGNDKKPWRIEKISTITDPPPGHSGYEIKAHMHELLEGIRPGRVVRIFPKAWNVSDIPREERMHMFDLRPRFLEVNPSVVPNPIPPLPK